MHGLAHPHKDRSQGLAAPQFLEQLVGDVGRSKVREDQDVGATLQEAEWVDLLQVCRNCIVGHEFAVHHERGIGAVQQFDGAAHLFRLGMLRASET